MAEQIRQRPIEFYNPRPMILGVCFFWGIVMGFSLNFFREPEIIEEPKKPPTEGTPSDDKPSRNPEDERLQNVPKIASIDDTATIVRRPSIDELDVPAPAVSLSTDGGLTGRTALPPTPRAPGSAGGGQYRPAPTGPPPIPDLLP